MIRRRLFYIVLSIPFWILSGSISRVSGLEVPAFIDRPQDFQNTIHQINTTYFHGPACGLSLGAITHPSGNAITPDRSLSQLPYFRFALLYLKFSAEEEVRWWNWNLRQNFVDFEGEPREILLSLRGMPFADYQQKSQQARNERSSYYEIYSLWPTMNNLELPRLKLAIANSLIQTYFGLDFFLQVEALSDRFHYDVLTALGYRREPHSFSEEFVAKAMLERIWNLIPQE